MIALTDQVNRLTRYIGVGVVNESDLNLSKTVSDALGRAGVRISKQFNQEQPLIKNSRILSSAMIFCILFERMSG